MVFEFLNRRGASSEAIETKASAAGRVIAWQTGGRVAWSPRDVVSLTRSGFAGNLPRRLQLYQLYCKTPRNAMKIMIFCAF